MKRSYPVPTTIDLDDADFDRILENFENSLYEYLDDEYREICRNNFKAIEELAELMTKEEVEEFINCEY